MGEVIFSIMIVFGLIAVWVAFYWLVLALACILSIVAIIAFIYVAYKNKELKGWWILIILIPVLIYTFPFFVQLIKLILAMIFQ